MCWRSAAEYERYLRMSADAAPKTSKPARSLVEVLRDLFRPRRAPAREAEVVPFPAGADARAGQKAGREGSKAA